jgi:replicative DNA helicase Mcm
MEREDLIERAASFLNEFYKEKILSAVTEGKKSVEIDFSLLDKFDVELADYLLENPEETIACMEEAVKQIDTGLSEAKIRLRFYNLPESRNIRIRNIRSEHIGKLIVVDGIVKRASEVRPEVSEAIFQCPACGRNIPVIQTERLVRPPIECECGNKKGFRLVEEKLYDARWIMIEEPYEIVSGERPSEIMIYLKEDLTSPKMQTKTDPGNRIRVVGILKEIPRRVKGSRSRQMEIFIDANHVESVETVWEELEITPEDEKRIIEAAKDPEVFNKLIASIAPSMYGLEDVKEAIILQLFGADPKVLKDKTKIRGNIHILLIGDPSSGKCVSGSTYVTLQDGSITKIKDVVEKVLKKEKKLIDDGYFAVTNHNTFSMDLNCRIIPSIANIVWKRQAPPYMYKVITQTGSSIITTPTHLFFTLSSNGITAKRAEELTLDDYVCVVGKIPSFGNMDKLTVKIKRRRRAKRVKLPTKITPEFCRFLGYIISESYIQERKNSGCIYFTNTDRELINDFKLCCKKLFRISPKERKSRKGKNAFVYLSSIEVIDFLKELDSSLLKPSRYKRIPQAVLRASKNNLANLLRALFDGEGEVSSYSRSISFTSASKELINQVRLLLLRFGILSQVHSRRIRVNGRLKSYYRLTISGANVLKYKNEIGFTSKKKLEKLKDVCKEMLGSEKDVLFLKVLSNSDVIWEKVLKIERIKSKSKWVYDLQVLPYHNFVANNFIVHNSQLMQLVSKLMPRGKYVSGSGVTAAGITASVVRDEEFLGGWVLEAGALVMANKSICCIDEFSKVSPQDRVALQEAMSLETISIAKASIVATLPAQTAILAGGNPKLGRFDPYIPIREQVDIDDVLLSRFDLKFALRDVPNPEIDSKVADHILRMRQHEEEAKPYFEPDFIRKWIAYARTHIHPTLTPEAGNRIKEFYLEMRQKAGEEAPVAITLRQYEALLRLAEASARVRLSNKVELEDAERAIRLMKVSLRQFGFEPETGAIDIDRAEGARVTSAQRSKIRIMLDIIEELTNTFGKEIPVDEIIRRAKDQKVDDAEEILRKMQYEGIVYSPRNGFISKV